MKEQLKAADDPRVKPVKYLLNAAYGKTAQMQHGRGTLTNFFYASYITAGTRLQLLNAYLSASENALELATDSILTNRELNLNLSREIGAWSLQHFDRGLLIGSGIRQTWLNDEEFITHARGLTDRRDYDIYNAIREANGESKIWYSRNRPLHLGEILTHKNILKLEQLGRFSEIRKSLNVNTDRKDRKSVV